MMIKRFSLHVNIPSRYGWALAQTFDGSCRQKLGNRHSRNRYWFKLLMKISNKPTLPSSLFLRWIAAIYDELGQMSSRSNESRSPALQWARSCFASLRIGTPLCIQETDTGLWNQVGNFVGIEIAWPDQETQWTCTREEFTFPSNRPLSRGHASSPSTASTNQSSADSGIRSYPTAIHHWNEPTISVLTTLIYVNAEAPTKFWWI